eukprot:9760245-Alexandrium_andersonii.AAC.1
MKSPALAGLSNAAARCIENPLLAARAQVGSARGITARGGTPTQTPVPGQAPQAWAALGHLALAN